MAPNVTSSDHGCVIRINVSGQIAELPDTALGVDLIKWAESRTFPGARADRLRLVFRNRFIEPAERLASLGLKEHEWIHAVEGYCMHMSPYDPERGGYLCGWC